jgi:membrane fusion protein
LDLQLRERNTQRSLQALQREAQSLRAEMVSLQTSEQTSLAQLERVLASLSQEATENDARNGLTIKAPQAGRVSALTWHLGQSVQAGQTLLGLVPEGTGGQVLEAQLYAPSRTAGFVREGQTVWLRYAAYPYQKFGMAEGVVDSVSQTPIAAQDLPSGQSQALMNAAQSNEPLYRIGVRLKTQAIMTYGQAQLLKVGMALDADVLQDKRAIWEWVMEPALATSGLLK